MYEIPSTRSINLHYCFPNAEASKWIHGGTIFNDIRVEYAPVDDMGRDGSW